MLPNSWLVVYQANCRLVLDEAKLRTLRRMVPAERVSLARTTIVPGIFHEGVLVGDQA